MAGSWLAERRERPRADVLRFDAIGVTFDAAGRLRRARAPRGRVLSGRRGSEPR